VPGKFLKLPSKLTSTNTLNGFVYVSDEEDGPMRNAREGMLVRAVGGGPPWIVVVREPASVIIGKWPGRLWQVKIVKAASRKDQPLPYARYTRATSVAVEHAEDVAILFGPHGRRVIEVLDVALKLDRQQAETLALNRHPEASAAHDRTWRRWLKQENIPDVDYDDLDGTLSLGMPTWGSPINQGLTVLHTVVFKRAQAVDSDLATESDDEDIWLVHPWNMAATVLSDTALALGAPQAVNDSDRQILLHGWSSLF
jgi:hypothetical protein